MTSQSRHGKKAKGKMKLVAQTLASVPRAIFVTGVGSGGVGR